jgi:hypothetical protein
MIRQAPLVAVAGRGYRGRVGEATLLVRRLQKPTANPELMPHVVRPDAVAALLAQLPPQGIVLVVDGLPPHEGDAAGQVEVVVLDAGDLLAGIALQAAVGMVAVLGVGGAVGETRRFVAGVPDAADLVGVDGGVAVEQRVDVAPLPVGLLGTYPDLSINGSDDSFTA